MYCICKLMACWVVLSLKRLIRIISVLPEFNYRILRDTMRHLEWLSRWGKKCLAFTPVRMPQQMQNELWPYLYICLIYITTHFTVMILGNLHHFLLQLGVCFKTTSSMTSKDISIYISVYPSLLILVQCLCIIKLISALSNHVDSFSPWQSTLTTTQPKNAPFKKVLDFN